MIKKIGGLGISLLCLAAMVSCEKDFSDLGGHVVANTKFETGELLLDVEIEKIDIANTNTNDAYKAVRADNISLGSLGEYWLGVSKNNENYKGIEASVISQLAYVSGLKNKAISGTDTIYNLDKVILKIPYKTTAKTTSKQETSFELDSFLGNLTEPTALKVFQNETFLKNDNPTPNNPGKRNTYLSNAEYLGDNLLNEDPDFTFIIDTKKDTVFNYQRIDRMDTSKTYLEAVKVKKSSKTAAVPFLAIPLDLAKMKTLFWDKFEGANFASKQAFDVYFKGLKIMASGEKGALIPLNLTNDASLVFQYSKAISKEGKVASSENEEYSFALSGIKNSKYVMSEAKTPVPSNNFVIQGTAGSMAKITLLNTTKLQELKAEHLLINDASLTFHVNQNINTDKKIVPQKLFIYQNIDKGIEGVQATQLTDAYKEAAVFGGNLEVSEDDKPEKYSFKITDYITNLLEGNGSIDPLVLKVYNNPTDNAFKNKVPDVNVKTYNWNPRGVTLLNGNKTANGIKRAVLKISYSKEK
ncbi:DUF4270 family protein [Tenacibaculum finnmarkense]|uniref:DUF4270 family protein n=1 Tax=Tenacibaculum finnmarkense TaxID=2781243 RepID=UPI001E609629|nr:DUF4270 family protein [Tenacibaculum finnmarkense]MCD8446333.1 DUF4270 domain-containing protein [Tenacibaculum finnmarkense genomovar finnmarkense]